MDPPPPHLANVFNDLDFDADARAKVERIFNERPDKQRRTQAENNEKPLENDLLEYRLKNATLARRTQLEQLRDRRIFFEENLADLQRQALAQAQSVGDRITRVANNQLVDPTAANLVLETASRYSFLVPPEEVADVLSNNIRAQLEQHITSGLFTVQPDHKYNGIYELLYASVMQTDTSQMSQSDVDRAIELLFESTPQLEGYFQKLEAMLKEQTDRFLQLSDFGYLGLSRANLVMIIDLINKMDADDAEFVEYFAEAREQVDTYLSRMKRLLRPAVRRRGTLDDLKTDLEDPDTPVDLCGVFTLSPPFVLSLFDAYRVVSATIRAKLDPASPDFATTLDEASARVEDVTKRFLQYELKLSVAYGEMFLGQQAYESSLAVVNQELASLDEPTAHAMSVTLDDARETLTLVAPSLDGPSSAWPVCFSPTQHFRTLFRHPQSTYTVDREDYQSGLYGFALFRDNNVYLSSLVDVTVRQWCVRCEQLVEATPGQERVCTWRAPYLTHADWSDVLRSAPDGYGPEYLVRARVVSAPTPGLDEHLEDPATWLPLELTAELAALTYDALEARFTVDGMLAHLLARRAHAVSTWQDMATDLRTFRIAEIFANAIANGPQPADREALMNVNPVEVPNVFLQARLERAYPPPGRYRPGPSGVFDAPTVGNVRRLLEPELTAEIVIFTTESERRFLGAVASELHLVAKAAARTPFAQTWAYDAGRAPADLPDAVDAMTLPQAYVFLADFPLPSHVFAAGLAAARARVAAARDAWDLHSAGVDQRVYAGRHSTTSRVPDLMRVGERATNGQAEFLNPGSARLHARSTRHLQRELLSGKRERLVTTIFEFNVKNLF